MPSLTPSIGTIGPTQPPGSQFADTIGRIEEKDWDSVWWPDHFMGWYPQSVWTSDLVDIADQQPSPHTIFETFTSLGYAAGMTERIQIGTHVTQPLRCHPVTLAQAFLTLHHLTDGRILFGFGPGERKDTVPYGLEYDWQVSKFEESLDIIRLAWNTPTREPFDYEGRFWQLEDAVFDLPPIGNNTDSSYPPIWVGAHGPRMLSITGRYADGWLPVSLSPDVYQKSWERIAEAARDKNRDPDSITRAISLPLVIDETTAACEALLDSLLLRLDCLQTSSHIYKKYGYEHPLGDDFNGLTDYVPSRLDREEALTAAEQVPIEIVKHTHLWGSPDDVIETLSEYVNTGVEHFVVNNQTYLADPAKTPISFKLLDKVRTHIQNSATNGP